MPNEPAGARNEQEAKADRHRIRRRGDSPARVRATWSAEALKGAR